MRLFLTFAFYLLLQCAEAADKAKFKTCDQTGFCKYVFLLSRLVMRSLVCCI